MSNPYKKRELREILAQGEADRARSILTVFVAGPFVQLDQRYPLAAYPRPSAQLRHYLIDKIESELEHNVHAGEHRELMAAAGHRFGRGNNAHTSELRLAKNNAHAVILIPDSPGSFTELGSWVTEEDICRKMLILACEQNRSAPGYITQGSFLQAALYRSQVQFVDYTRPDDSWPLVLAFLEEIESVVQVRGMHN